MHIRSYPVYVAPGYGIWHNLLLAAAAQCVTALRKLMTAETSLQDRWLSGWYQSRRGLCT
jgi:hypothetical protein